MAMRISNLLNWNDHIEFIMEMKQYWTGGLSHASYMIFDRGAQTAAVVDPQRDIDRYLQDAEHLGVMIRHVFLTHFHNELLTGHIELRNRTGATIYLGRRAEAEYAFQPLAEGERIEFGQTRLQILETPGHTLESTCILVFDLRTSDGEPRAVLSGNTLLIGDVARPDPSASSGATADEMAGVLYESITAKLAPLPDATLVYPAHGGGSVDAGHRERGLVSTIGVQKKENPGMRAASREEFLRLVAADASDVPRYYRYDAERNRQDRPDLESTLRYELEALSVNELLRLQEEGACVLDVREGAEFEASHLSGAINIPLEDCFASWTGTLLDASRPIALIADPGTEAETLLRLAQIGFDNVVGFLGGGIHALHDHRVLLRRTVRISATALAEHLQHDSAPAILDVRPEPQWRNEHLAGSVNIPLGRLPGAIDRVPSIRPLVVSCQSGYHSAIAASLLEREGFEGINVLVGGVNAWKAAGLPVEAARPAAAP